MRNDKQKVLELRMAGKSYKEIMGEINISKSTLSDWLKELSWSKEIKEDLTQKANFKSNLRLVELNKIRGTKLKNLYAQAREEATLDCELFRNNPLFVAGVMIYWGEGDKVSKNSFRIANTDPVMIKVFVEFLTKICNVKIEKIRASLLIYPDIPDIEAKKFWTENTGLDYSHFTKSTVIVGRHKTRILQNGVCTLNASSTYLKQKMLIWLKLLPEMLVYKKF